MSKTPIYKRKDLMKKLTFVSSVATLIGLVAVFIPGESQSNNQNSYGDQSPNISDSGDIIINYGDLDKSAKEYVLRHPNGGSVLVVNKPDPMSAMDPETHVCMVKGGTPVIPLDQIAQIHGLDMFQTVKITHGRCNGKVGWAAIENIRYE